MRRIVDKNDSIYATHIRESKDILWRGKITNKRRITKEKEHNKKEKASHGSKIKKVRLTVLFLRSAERSELLIESAVQPRGHIEDA